MRMQETDNLRVETNIAVRDEQSNAGQQYMSRISKLLLMNNFEDWNFGSLLSYRVIYLETSKSYFNGLKRSRT